MSQIERRNKKLTLKGLKYRLDKNKKLKCDLIKQNLMSDLTAKNLNNLKSSVEAQVSDVTNSYVSDSNNNDYSEYSVIFEEDFHESDSDGESDNDDSILDLNLDHTIISDTIQNVLVNLDPAVTKDVWQFIQNWAVEFSIQRTAVTALLHYLNKYFPDLPLDSRTVLKTPREIVTTEVPPGRYYHIGTLQYLMSADLQKQLYWSTSNSTNGMVLKLN
jgi:hypothetical protein